MFGGRGRGFGWGVGGTVPPGDVPPVDATAQNACGVGRVDPPPPVTPPPATMPATAVRVVEGLYAQVPPAEATLFQREAMVPFNLAARGADDSGTIFSFVVPSGQTLLLTDAEFSALRANPITPGDQLGVEPRQLAGYVALHLFVDERSPIDLYSEIVLPTGAAPGVDPIRGSFFSAFGSVIGGAARQPFGVLRVREGQSLRLAYTVARAPVIGVDTIGALARGFLVPTAIAAAKTAS